MFNLYMRFVKISYSIIPKLLSILFPSEISYSVIIDACLGLMLYHICDQILETDHIVTREINRISMLTCL